MDRPIVRKARKPLLVTNGCPSKNGKRSRHSSTGGPSVAGSTTVLWAAALVINVDRSMRVLSVVKTTLGTATTEPLVPARWTWIDHLAHGPQILQSTVTWAAALAAH